MDHIISRKIDIPTAIDKVITLIGPRRSGKTSILFDMIRQLRQSVGKDRIVNLNFEDDRLFPIHLQDLQQINEAYYSICNF